MGLGRTQCSPAATKKHQETTDTAKHGCLSVFICGFIFFSVGNAASVVGDILAGVCGQRLIRKGNGFCILRKSGTTSKETVRVHGGAHLSERKDLCRADPARGALASGSDYGAVEREGPRRRIVEPVSARQRVWRGPD